MKQIHMEALGLNITVEDNLFFEEEMVENLEEHVRMLDIIYGNNIERENPERMLLSGRYIVHKNVNEGDNVTETRIHVYAQNMLEQKITTFSLAHQETEVLQSINAESILYKALENSQIYIDSIEQEIPGVISYIGSLFAVEKNHGVVFSSAFMNNLLPGELSRAIIWYDINRKSSTEYTGQSPEKIINNFINL